MEFGRVLVRSLKLAGTGSYTLTNASNDVTTLAGAPSGPVSFTDLDDLTVGTVGGTTGLATTNSAITLNAGTTLALNGAVSAGTSDVTLNAGGAVTQSAPITAAGLKLDRKGVG